MMEDGIHLECDDEDDRDYQLALVTVNQMIERIEKLERTPPPGFVGATE